MRKIAPSLQPLEHSISTKLIPALTGRPPPNDIERELLALPARLGGLALANPTQATNVEYHTSVKISGPLQSAIVLQDFDYTRETVENQLEAKREIQRLRLTGSRKRCLFMANCFAN